MRNAIPPAPRSRLDHDIEAFRRDGGTIEPSNPPTRAPVRVPASEVLAELGRRTLEEARAARAEELKAEAAALQRLGSSAPRQLALDLDRRLTEVLVDVDPFWVRWSAFIGGEGGGRVGPSWR
jgi:hypothetical protein